MIGNPWQDQKPHINLLERDNSAMKWAIWSYNQRKTTPTDWSNCHRLKNNLQLLRLRNQGVEFFKADHAP